VNNTPDVTTTKDLGRTALRELFPLVLLTISAAVGYAIDALYTFTLLGALLAAVIRMRIRPSKSTTLSPRLHWAATILVTGAFGATFSLLLAGWSKGWKSFAVQVVLAPLPIMMGLGHTVVSYLPDRDIAKANEEYAQINAHPELLAEEISYYTDAFKNGDLVYLDPGDDYVSVKDMLGRDAWLIEFGGLAYNPFEKLAPNYAMTMLKRIGYASQWTNVAVFMSPQAFEADSERKAAYTLNQTGKTDRELLDSEEGIKILHGLDFPYYPSISMVTCQYDDRSGELISIDAPMAAYHLDVTQIEAFEPLVDMCEEVASGASLDHFPRDLSAYSKNKDGGSES
jgi:hypothetical protein